MQLLFYTRLALYLSAFLIPVFHPAVAVAYDWLNRVMFFVLLPASMFAAFYLRGPRFRVWHGLAALAVLYAGTVFFVTGLDRSALLPLLVTVLGYIWTVLVFRGQGRFPAFAAIEMFGLAIIYLRILEYGRASEEIAARSAGLSTFLIAFAVLLFLVHGLVLYFSAFPGAGGRRNRTELAIFFAVGLPLALIFGHFVPSDFVQNKIVMNELEKEPPLKGLDGDGRRDGEGQGRRRPGEGEGEQERHNRNGKPLGDREEKYPSELQGEGNSADGQGREGQPGRPGEGRPGEEKPGEGQGGRPGKPGEGQSEQKEQKEQQDNQQKNKLHGVPSEMWNNFKNSSGANGKQMAVMIIASKIQPVYAAEQYLGRLDAKTGFEQSVDEPLNELRDLRLLETWKDKSVERDTKRVLYDVYYLSTLRERVVAYRPFAIQPTILDQKYHPFDLSYTASSAVSVSNPDDWKNIREPHFDESMKQYLDVPLDEKRLVRYRAFLNSRLKGKHGYFDRLAGILEGFSAHQYKMGFEEDTSLEGLDKFLFETKEGDCTEFSRAAAILGRLSGIPSRVVTGYLASRDLQTPAHRGGIKHLRDKIPALQKFPMEELYLVTNAQRHAWVQFYLPEYGWVDFESTAYAIPPKPEFDPNARDVVIPLIDEEPLPPEKKKFDFPWMLFGIFSGILVGSILLSLYLYRFIRLTIYSIIAGSGVDRRSVDAVATLLYIRLAEDGYPIRQFYETPLDYAKQIPETKAFADRLTELRFRESWSAEQRKQSYADLRRLGSDTGRSMRRPGAWNSLKRVFTLRGILYRP